MIEDYEEFTDEQRRILERYVTNTKSHIFCLRNLPEVIKGALFSRYSRSTLGLRSLLLKDFISNDDESSFQGIAGSMTDKSEEQLLAIRKAQNFYDRILDGYGDDSIGELGGAHLAIENVSMLAAKLIEDQRIGGSPLEKSTRYIYFDQKVNGEYLYYREPIIMTSAYRNLFVETCDRLFDTYSQLVPPMTAIIEKEFPKDPDISNLAYNAALRAKVLDCLRGLLPASTLTNMGIYGNGRFYDYLIHKLRCHNLVELQEIGSRSYQELFKIIPSFIRRAEPEHHTHQSFATYYEGMQTQLKLLSEQHAYEIPKTKTSSYVRLIDWNEGAVEHVAAGLLFTHSDASLASLRELIKDLPAEEVARIFDAASSPRENRRHKSPRALEFAEFTFEIISDFGAYRDLHRHRILTQERQLLTCNYDFYIPNEIRETNLESQYVDVLNQTKDAYDTIAAELPEEAQYIVPMAYNIRWYFHVNLRALQWLTELRSSPAGHPTYRAIAQEMAKQVTDKFPEFEPFFRFVDFDGYELGRLGQEQRKSERLSANQ